MQKEKLVLKICIGDWRNASRDKRELRVVESLGARVIVMAKGDHRIAGDSVDGFTVDRYSTRPLGIRVPNAINRAVSFFTWAHYARKYDADIISGHDFVALLIGKTSNCFKKHKAKLVYDSHEFELGRNADRNALARFFVSKLEKSAIKASEFTIVVNDSIADAVAGEYSLDERPVVVRNIPEYFDLDQDRVSETRRSILDSFGSRVSSLIMYHGGITTNRGLETLIKTVPVLDDTGMLIVGDAANRSYRDHLDECIRSSHAEDRVIILDAKPFNELIYYVAAADVGMIIIPPTCMSYYYMLPNKLFENIQAETPVITSDFPEIKKIVSGYGIGRTVDAGDEEMIKRCIEELLGDRAAYDEYENNLKAAKRELCWEKERIRLAEAYGSLIR